MSKIVWDKTGERLYETGVDHAVLYKYVSGAPGAGVAEATPLYADNIKYVTLRSVEEFGGTIEAYTYPDEFAECDGSAEPVKGVKFGQQTRKVFGLCYRTKIGNDEDFDDHGYKLHLVYGATASPSEKQNQTINDSPEAITLSWEFETSPVAVAGYKPVAHIEIDSTKADAEKLAALEEILYGKDGTGEGGSTGAVDPRLPLPAEVITLMTAA